MIYLDNAATTPIGSSAADAMTRVMTDTFGNPSSIHAYGREASKILRQARESMAKLLQVPARKLIFTSGGTESNNTAIKGYALANQNKGKHIITTAIEHHSVLHTMDYLSERFGFDITYIQPENQVITAQQIADALRSDTILVSVMYANNETGQLLPIKEIAELLTEHQAVFHVDAVQAAGKLTLQPETIGIDFLSISAHKFHGPKGVGLLYHNDLHFDNLLHGGEQEDKRRASTENLIGIAGMAAAYTEANQNMKDNYAAIEELKTAFLNHLKIDYKLNMAGANLPHVINVSFPKQNNSTLLTLLDLAGFAVSTGSACTAGTVEPSHVLQALYGKDSDRLNNSIRISLSDQNTRSEVIALAEQLNKIIGE
ncbi:cysteine desulfurase family protein [Streptococcus dentiloxodontae]